jgi:hypothetical protein
MVGRINIEPPDAAAGTAQSAQPALTGAWPAAIQCEQAVRRTAGNRGRQKGPH